MPSKDHRDELQIDTPYRKSNSRLYTIYRQQCTVKRKTILQ